MKNAGLIFLFGILIPLHLLVKTSESSEVDQAKNSTADDAISSPADDRAAHDRTIQEHSGNGG